LTHINAAAADAEVLASTNERKMTLRRFGGSPRNHCHIDAGRADKTAANRNDLADIAVDGNAYQIAPVDRPVFRSTAR
jgi:hypothetical protein